MKNATTLHDQYLTGISVFVSRRVSLIDNKE